MNAPLDTPLLHRDFLLGKRPYSPQARLFLPDPAFNLVPVQYLPETIWRNPRRRLKQTHFNDETSLISLVIPFIEAETTQTHGPFELVWLWGAEGQTVAYAWTAQEALEQHNTWADAYRAAGLSETLNQ